MKQYTAMVSWMTLGKRTSYLYRSKTIRHIFADDIVEASKIALDKITGKIQPAVNCIWQEIK